MEGHLSLQRKQTKSGDRAREGVRDEKPDDGFNSEGALLCYKMKLMRIVDISIESPGSDSVM